MKKNIIYQWLYQILTILLPIITTPYISRVLGVDNIGIFSYQYSVTNYFMLFAMLGVNTYGNRYIAQHKDRYDDLCNAFSEVYFAQISVAVVVSVIYIIYVIEFSKYPLIALIQSIYVVGCIFDINWLYFGLEKFKVTVTRNFVVKITTVILILIFVKNSTHLNRYVLIMALGTVISQCIMWMPLKRYVKLRKVSLRCIITHYKGMLILFIPSVATSIYKIMDKIMLGSITSITEVGYYENSEKIINLLLSFLSSIGTVMLPRVSNLVVNGENYKIKKYLDISMELVMLVAVGMAFGLVSIVNEFVPFFFGEGYEKCIDVISILTYSIIFSSAANIIRTQYLIPYNKDLQYIISLIVGAFINLIVNLMLISRYASIGAAVGTLVAEATVCIFQFIVVAGEISYIKYIIQISIYVFMGYIMKMILAYISCNNNILLMSIKIVAGVLVYGIMAFVFLIFRHGFNVRHLRN